MLFQREITWFKLFDSVAAAEMQIPAGRVQTIIAGNKKICIAHTSEGFFAVHDKCPHNGASLGNGFCTKENSIVCPVHHYHFDLRTGRAKSGLGDFVETYPVEIRSDGVFVGFSKLRWKFF